MKIKGGHIVNLLNRDEINKKDDEEYFNNTSEDNKNTNSLLKTIFFIILAFVFPPVLVIIKGAPGQFAVNLLLTIFFWIPGIIHALMVLNQSMKKKNNK